MKTIEDRITVGLSDLGNVFIHHFAKADPATNALTKDQTWEVRAGNHTVASVSTPEEAHAIARGLCGENRLDNEYIAADGPVPVPEAPAEVPAPAEEPEPGPANAVIASTPDGLYAYNEQTDQMEPVEEPAPDAPLDDTAAADEAPAGEPA